MTDSHEVSWGAIPVRTGKTSELVRSVANIARAGKETAVLVVSERERERVLAMLSGLTKEQRKRVNILICGVESTND